ncbi:MAG: hypothetical protein IJT25_02075 [Clostridia bacterium]|nr:hypothetical protein [Clostridia bacterium]
MYNGVKNINCDVKVKNENRVVLSKKQQTFFGFFLILIVCFNLLNISLANSDIGTYAKKIINFYASSNDDIGKIKYVDSQENGASMVFNFIDIDYCLPFKNGAVSQNDDGRIFVQGGSDVMVVCPYKSTVKEIVNENLKKTVVLDCGFSVNMLIINLDNVGVKVGAKLNKGDKIGVCFDSLLEIKVTFKGKLFDKIKVVDGKLSL